MEGFRKILKDASKSIGTAVVNKIVKQGHDPKQLIFQPAQDRNVPPRRFDEQILTCEHCNAKLQKKYHCRLCALVCCRRCSTKCQLPKKFYRSPEDDNAAALRVCWGCFEDCLITKFESDPSEKKGKRYEMLLDRRENKVMYIPVWQPREYHDNCYKCNDKGKGYNCRLCGALYCDDCTSKLDVPSAYEKKANKVAANKVDGEQRVKARVCDECRWHTRESVQLLELRRPEAAARPRSESRAPKSLERRAKVAATASAGPTGQAPVTLVEASESDGEQQAPAMTPAELRRFREKVAKYQPIQLLPHDHPLSVAALENERLRREAEAAEAKRELEAQAAREARAAERQREKEAKAAAKAKAKGGVTPKSVSSDSEDAAPKLTSDDEEPPPVDADDDLDQPAESSSSSTSSSSGATSVSTTTTSLSSSVSTAVAVSSPAADDTAASGTGAGAGETPKDKPVPVKEAVDNGEVTPSAFTAIEPAGTASATPPDAQAAAVGGAVTGGTATAASTAEQAPVPVLLSVHWEHEGEKGLRLMALSCLDTASLAELAPYIDSVLRGRPFGAVAPDTFHEIIEPAVLYAFTCKGHVVPVQFWNIFTVKSLAPILYIRRCFKKRYVFDEEDGDYNLVRDELDRTSVKYATISKLIEKMTAAVASASSAAAAAAAAPPVNAASPRPQHADHNEESKLGDEIPPSFADDPLFDAPPADEGTDELPTPAADERRGTSMPPKASRTRSNSTSVSYAHYVTPMASPMHHSSTSLASPVAGSPANGAASPLASPSAAASPMAQPATPLASPSNVAQRSPNNQQVVVNDFEVRRVFLLTYQSFMTPRALLQALRTRYFAPVLPATSPAASSSKAASHAVLRKSVQLKVTKVFQDWLKDYFSDFSGKEMAEDWKSFSAELYDTSKSTILRDLYEKRKKAVEALDTSLLEHERFLQQWERNLVENGPAVEKQRAASVTREDFELRFERGDWKGLERDLTQQLTLVDSAFFKSINPREFLNTAWSNEKTKMKNAPNLVRMIQQGNRVGWFVQSTILRSGQNYPDSVAETKQETRAACFAMWVAVADACVKLKNFNAAFTIYCSLAANPIHRLKKTKAFLKPSVERRVEALKALFSTAGNSKEYRAALKRATNDPCVPHLGIFLTDLTMTEDNSDNEVNGLVNFRKRVVIANVVRGLMDLKGRNYEVWPIPAVVRYLTSLPDATDDELWKLSLKVEPRDS